MVERSGGAGEVHDGLFLDRAVDVVCAVLQAQLREMVPDVHSVGLDVRDVVEHQAGHSDGSKDFCSRCELCLRKASVVGKKRIGHKALEPLGFVVQFTKRNHVLNALFKRFNRTKQHGAV